MRFLLELPASGDLKSLREAALGAQSAGLDGIVLAQAPEMPAPLLTAAALAPELPDLRLAVEVEAGERHPLELAEEAAVVDLISGGRLVLITRPAATGLEDYPEALSLLACASTARPFTFKGRRWRVPAELESNIYRIDSQVRMMPAPAQLRMQIWSAGRQARPHALSSALGYLAEPGEERAALGEAYREAERVLGPALAGAIRAQRDHLDSVQALTARLREGRRLFGQDCVVIPGDERTAWVLAEQVLPRVQLNVLPQGLEEFWARAHAQLPLAAS